MVFPGMHMFICTAQIARSAAVHRQETFQGSGRLNKKLVLPKKAKGRPALRSAFRRGLIADNLAAD
jgi:hypothetical protein